MIWRILSVLALCLAFAVPLQALEPDEQLDDPALEARARDLSEQLRCMVCQNQSIDESDAPLARDLRLLVRERLQAGDSEREIKNFVVARYGEFVLLRPPFSARTALLWLAPVLLLAAGALALWLAWRRRGQASQVNAAPLSAEEDLRLSAVLERLDEAPARPRTGERHVPD